jgi:hypothetical protein
VNSKSTIILQPPTGPGSWTTGGFVLFGRATKELKSAVNIIEDGFAAVLEPGSWDKLREALALGLPVDIRGNGGDRSVRIEFAKSEKGVRGKAAVMTHIVLFNTDPEFAESGVNAYTLSAYMDEIGNTVSAVLDGYPVLEADGLLVAVAVRPGSRVKIWCEAADGAFEQTVLRTIEAKLEKIRPPLVRKGTIAFSVAGPRWGRSSGFPKAWTDVVEKAGKPLTVNEILAIIWKD